MDKKKKLNKAPLREVIFELLWSIPLDHTGFPVDPNFSNIYNKFSNSIKNLDFQLHKELPINPNVKVYPKIQHQFWKGELQWPVVQIGQGIFAVNDVSSSYEWGNSYFPTLKEALKILISSSNEKLKIQKLSFRYVNSVDLEDEGFLSFISNKLKTKITNDFQINGKFKGINILQSFDLEDSTILSIAIQTVINNLTKKPAIVWVISAEKLEIPDAENVIDWASFVHKKISDVFYDMINKELYANFI